MNTYSASKLDNGLTVITGENKSSPIVTLQLVVKAGSAYENSNELGYAHILEHMLLKGTKKRPSSYDIGLEIDRMGASSNAATSYNSAWFIMQSASDHVEKLCEILSDNIRNPLLDQKFFENEKNVIQHEINGSANKLPRVSTVEALVQYTNHHPISQDPLGSIKSVSSSQITAVAEYYRRFYVPSNCALIITGSISGKDSMDLARKYFGDWASSPFILPSLPPIILTKESTGFRKHQSNIDVMTICYGAPSPATLSEQLSIELLLTYLSYGYTSALRNELRSKRGLSYSPSAFARYFNIATLITISTSTDRAKDVLNVVDEIVSKLPEIIDQNWVDAIRKQTIGILERKLSDPSFEAGLLRENYIKYQKLVSPQDVIIAFDHLSVKDVQDSVKQFTNMASRFAFVLGQKPLN